MVSTDFMNEKRRSDSEIVTALKFCATALLQNTLTKKYSGWKERTLLIDNSRRLKPRPIFP